MLQNSLSVNSLKARQLSATATGIVSSDTRRTKSPSGRRKSTSCRLTKAFTAVQAFTRPCSSSLSSSRSTRTPPPGTVSTQTSGMVGTRSPAARCCRCPHPHTPPGSRPGRRSRGGAWSPPSCPEQAPIRSVRLVPPQRTGLRLYPGMGTLRSRRRTRRDSVPAPDFKFITSAEPNLKYWTMEPGKYHAREEDPT